MKKFRFLFIALLLAPLFILKVQSQNINTKQPATNIANASDKELLAPATPNKCIDITCENIQKLFDALADGSLSGELIDKDKYKTTICFDKQDYSYVEGSTGFKWAVYAFMSGKTKEECMAHYYYLKGIADACLVNWAKEEIDKPNEDGKIYIVEDNKEHYTKEVSVGYSNVSALTLAKGEYYSYIMITVR